MAVSDSLKSGFLQAQIQHAACLEVCNGENLWQWSKPVLRPNSAKTKSSSAMFSWNIKKILMKENRKKYNHFADLNTALRVPIF